MIILINLDSLIAYQKKQYIIRPLIDIIEGKNAGLNEKHLRLVRLIGNLILYPSFKIVCPVLSMSISIVVLVAMYYAYFYFNVKYNPVIHTLWALYYCFVISQMVYSLFFVFIVVAGFSLHIKFMYTQVNELFKSKNIRKILRAIKMHKILCDQVKNFNDAASVHLTVFCLALTLGWDVAFYLALYGHNSGLRIVMANASVWLLFGSSFTFFCGAFFSSEAHKPYKIINSLILDTSLSVRIKWKVSFVC